VSRGAIVALLVVVLIGGLAVAVWTAVARERDYEDLLARGDAALAADQTDVAVEAYSGALALKDTSMVAYLRRGEAYRRRGDLGNAIRDLRAASRLDPSAERPLELLGDVNYSLERYPKAVESYQQFVALDERNPRVQYKLGLAMFRAGDTAGALPVLQKAVSLNDRLAEAHYLLGLCLKPQGRRAEAVKALEKAVALAPTMVAPREVLAEMLESAGRSREAIGQFESVAALEPDRPDRQTAVAEAYARSGKTDVAVGILGRAAERYPDNAVVYLALGRIWLDTAEPRRDRMALRKAIEALEPLTRGPRTSGEALTLYGRALILSGDLPGGAAALAQSADRLPVNPGTLLLLADVSERLGRTAVVRSALERWVALTQESGSTRSAVLERLGDVCLRLNDEPGAIRAWHKATEVNPAPAVFLRLAAAELHANRLADARATMAQALERNPRNQALLDYQRRIQ